MKLFFALLALLPFQAIAAADLQWSIEELRSRPDVHVESVTTATRTFEIVYLPNGESFEIPVDMNQLGARDLEPAQTEELRESSRQALELTMRGLLSENFSGEMMIGADGTEQVPTATTAEGVAVTRAPFFKRIMENNADAYGPFPKGLTYAQKAKRLGMIAWQFIVVETYHAGKEYFQNLRQAAASFQEYGLVINFKIEPQFFIAKFKPTARWKWTRHNYAFFFAFRFNVKTKKLDIRTFLRREQGAGGFASQAVKAELKVFESDGTHGPEGGKSWYSISPPFVSLVFDQGRDNHYFAQGISIGFNTGDLIPGSTLTNTFLNYEQTEYPMHLELIPQKISDALHDAVYNVTHGSAFVPLCSTLFL